MAIRITIRLRNAKEKKLTGAAGAKDTQNLLPLRGLSAIIVADLWAYE